MYPPQPHSPRLPSPAARGMAIQPARACASTGCLHPPCCSDPTEFILDRDPCQPSHIDGEYHDNVTTDRTCWPCVDHDSRFAARERPRRCPYGVRSGLVVARYYDDVVTGRISWVYVEHDPRIPGRERRQRCGLPRRTRTAARSTGRCQAPVAGGRRGSPAWRQIVWPRGTGAARERPMVG